MTDEVPQANMILQSFPVGPLGCNCSIIGDPISKKAIVIDPGGDADLILERLAALNLEVVQILHTHAHLDHFLASGTLKEATGAPLALHQDDRMLWDQLETQCRLFGIPYEPAPPPDRYLEHEEEFSLPHLEGKALHTPGHSPGSMCFLFESEKWLIAGDTLFKGSIGRTDLWGGDFKTIERSIKEQLYTLDEAITVVTGHGPETTIGDEVRHNPFIRA